MSAPVADRLAHIEAEIARHRRQYLDAYFVGETATADYHCGEVDRLLGMWADVQRAAEV